MAITRKSKIGKYVCKIGYLDIRQRLAHKKPTEVFIVHCRNILAGPFSELPNLLRYYRELQARPSFNTISATELHTAG